MYIINLGPERGQLDGKSFIVRVRGPTGFTVLPWFMHVAPPSDTNGREFISRPCRAPCSLRAYWNNFYSRTLLITLEQLRRGGRGFYLKKYRERTNIKHAKKFYSLFQLTKINSQFSRSSFYVPKQCDAIPRNWKSPQCQRNGVFCSFLIPAILVINPRSLCW